MFMEWVSVIESYSDGSGKNPSTRSAASFLIVKDQSIIHQEAFLLKDKTTNEAEYIALHSAIDYLCKEGYDRFTCYVDSELVYKQLKGEYRINKPELIIWNGKIKTLLEGKFMTIQWVSRDNLYIKQADSLNRKMLRIP